MNAMMEDLSATTYRLFEGLISLSIHVAAVVVGTLSLVFGVVALAIVVDGMLTHTDGTMYSRSSMISLLGGIVALVGGLFVCGFLAPSRLRHLR